MGGDEKEDEEELRVLVERDEELIYTELVDLYGFESANEEEEYSRLLSRFARARKGSAEKALKFLKEDAAWRKLNDCIALRKEPPMSVLGCSPAAVAEYYERRLLGLDLIGRPVYYQNYRHLIVRKLMTLCPLDVLERYHIWEQERAVALVDELHRNDKSHHGTMCVILDVGGMTLRRHVNSDFLKFVKAVAGIDQDHYPERMGVTMILNAPRAFGVVWSVVRPWLDPKTADKIKIFSNDAHDAIKEQLGEDIANALAHGDHSKDDFSSHGPDTVLEDPTQLARRLRIESGFDHVEIQPKIKDDFIELPVRRSFYGIQEEQDDEFHETRSPHSNDDELARQLWIAPIIIGKWQIAANVDEAADRLEKLVVASFIAVLGLLATALVAVRSESRRAPFLAIVASLASIPVGLLALAGCRLRNPDLLGAHVVAQVPTTLVFFGLGLASVVMSGQGSADSFFARSGGGTKIRSQYLALGAVGLVCCLLLAAQIVLSSKLAARIKHALFTPFPDWGGDAGARNVHGDIESGNESSRPPSMPAIHRGLKSPVFSDQEHGHTLQHASSSISETQKGGYLNQVIGHMKQRRASSSSSAESWHTRNVDVGVRQSRLALTSCSFLMACVGVAGIAYGAASTSYFVRRNIGGAALAPYLLIHSCVCLLVISLLGVGIASTQQDPQSLAQRVSRENLLSRVFDVDPRADRLRFLVKRDARLLVEMRIYKCLAIANLALCLVCVCIALSQIVSVAKVVKRDGDNRPQVARTASLALFLVVAVALIACCAIWISVRTLNALFMVQKQRRRLRCRQLTFELKKRARQSKTPQPQSPHAFSAEASRPNMLNFSIDLKATRSSRTRAFIQKLAKSRRMQGSWRPKTIDEVVRKRRNSRGIEDELYHDTLVTNDTTRESEVDAEEGQEQVLQDADIQLSAADEELLSDNDPPLASGFAHLSRNDKAAILFGMLYGLGQIFLDGTYAIFNVLIHDNGQNGRRRVPWFMALWHFYGKVDKRYRRSDNLIVALNALSALVLGPLCLVFVWTTYECRPVRHLLGLAATVLQLWTLIIYVATEARAGFRDCAPIDNFAVFWLGFVGVSLVRALIPLPVLYNATSSITDDAALAQRWRAILDTDAFHLDQARRYTMLPVTNTDIDNVQNEETTFSSPPPPPPPDEDDELLAYATPSGGDDANSIRRNFSEPSFIMGLR